MNIDGKTVCVKAALKPLALLLIAGLVLAGCSKDLPKDDAQLTEIKFEGLMGSRFTEILLVFGNCSDQKLRAVRLARAGSHLLRVVDRLG